MSNLKLLLVKEELQEQLDNCPEPLKSEMLTRMKERVTGGRKQGTVKLIFKEETIEIK